MMMFDELETICSNFDCWAICWQNCWPRSTKENGTGISKVPCQLRQRKSRKRNLLDHHRAYHWQWTVLCYHFRRHLPRHSWRFSSVSILLKFYLNIRSMVSSHLDHRKHSRTVPKGWALATTIRFAFASSPPGWACIACFLERRLGKGFLFVQAFKPSSRTELFNGLFVNSCGLRPV